MSSEARCGDRDQGVAGGCGSTVQGTAGTYAIAATGGGNNNDGGRGAGGASIAMSGGIEGAGIDCASEQGTGQPQAAGTAVPGSSRPRWVFRRLRAGPRRATWRRWFGLAATVLSVAAGTCWAAAWAGGSDQSAALSEWSPCAAANGAAGMQCAILNVPLDWNLAESATAQVAVARLPATGAHKLGVIVTNPGGPGISGIDDMAYSGNFWDRLRQDFDIVTFDPRGVGASRPAIALAGDELVAAVRNQPSIPRTEAQRRSRLEGTTRLVDAAQRGGVLGLVGTQEVARDLEALRVAMNVESIDYFGFSYGTYLGVVYADMFPGRTHRIVLDSAMNPANDYATLRHDQAVAFDHAIRAQFDAPEIQRIQALIERLDESPIVGEDGRVLSGLRLLNYVESAAYEPETSVPVLREVLAEASRGNWAPVIDAVHGPALLVNPADLPYLSVACHDLSTPTQVGDVAALARAWTREAPLTGASRAWSVLPCTVWPTRAAAPPHRMTAAGSGPTLVIGVAGDPATPPHWGRELAATLEHGQYLQWAGAGHVAYGRAGEPLGTIVNDFFVSGRLPPAGLELPAD
ncbi:Carboxylesterase A precursor [Mycobacterium marinum]|uniref:alpha/beta hydrolase n=1 Tax=Mycobacterium marinum TaxID=1781 RepID=UPI000EE1C1F9|nr:alpha/beta hydrolase [Mycobacterium marinum]RFZ19671.1 Carboxylesterase A precursor [Mycobacterium marinum]